MLPIGHIAPPDYAAGYGGGALRGALSSIATGGATKTEGMKEVETFADRGEGDGLYMMPAGQAGKGRGPYHWKKYPSSEWKPIQNAILPKGSSIQYAFTEGITESHGVQISSSVDVTLAAWFKVSASLTESYSIQKSSSKTTVCTAQGAGPDKRVVIFQRVDHYTLSKAKDGGVFDAGRFTVGTSSYEIVVEEPGDFDKDEKPTGRPIMVKGACWKLE